ncbi:MAG: hypothetical protein WBB48_07345 [Thermodesulfobacteriota bacterium]
MPDIANPDVFDCETRKEDVYEQKKLNEQYQNKEERFNATG